MKDIKVSDDSDKVKLDKGLKKKRRITIEIPEIVFDSISNKTDSKDFINSLCSYLDPTLEVGELIKNEEIDYLYSALISYIMVADLYEVGYAFYVDKIMFNPDTTALNDFVKSAFKFSFKDLSLKEVNSIASVVSSFKSVKDKILSRLQNDLEASDRIFDGFTVVKTEMERCAKENVSKERKKKK